MPWWQHVKFWFRGTVRSKIVNKIENSSMIYFLVHQDPVVPHPTKEDVYILKGSVYININIWRQKTHTWHQNLTTQHVHTLDTNNTDISVFFFIVQTIFIWGSLQGWPDVFSFSNRTVLSVCLQTSLKNHYGAALFP